MVDTIVIIIFSVFIMLVGFSFSKTGNNLKSFFAGGKSVSWLIAGLSLFMSFFSAGTFVAWGSIAYKYGWVAVTIQWTMCIGGLVTGIFLAPRWKATGNLTAAEFIKDRLGSKVQKFYIYIFMIVSLFIKGSVLYSVSKLVGTSLNYPLLPVTIILGILMISYTAIGGLWAVMITDILQFVILTASVIIIIPLVFENAGGVHSFLSKVPDSFFNLVNGEFTWGFIFAFAIYHIFYIGGNWTFVQRYASVGKPSDASKVAYLFAALYILAPILWMIPPMVYRSIDPSLSGIASENAYIMVCKKVLPPGLLGLMLTGMYFSTSASANTALNVVSAVYTNDIYKGVLKPNASDKKLMSVARSSSWMFGIGMILIALAVPYIGGVVEFTLSIGAVTAGPLLLPPIWALFSKRLTGKSALVITIVSLAVNLFFKFGALVIKDIALSRASEMLLGVLLPFISLLINELYATYRNTVSDEFIHYRKVKQNRIDANALNTNAEDLKNVQQQNLFGLKVLSFSLAFIGLLLYALSFFGLSHRLLIILIATLVLLSALIPYTTYLKNKRSINAI